MILAFAAAPVAFMIIVAGVAYIVVRATRSAGDRPAGVSRAEIQAVLLEMHTGPASVGGRMVG